MITIACTKCAHAIRVVGDVSEVDQLVGQRSDFWPDKYVCFHCGERCEGFLTPEISEFVLAKLNIFDLTPNEAFAALNGMGVPSEHTCCADVVVPLLEAQGIKVKGRELRGQQRYFLDEIHLPDGTKLFFGASPQGAVIYRITKPHSYVQAVEKQNVG